MALLFVRRFLAITSLARTLYGVDVRAFVFALGDVDRHFFVCVAGADHDHDCICDEMGRLSSARRNTAPFHSDWRAWQEGACAEAEGAGADARAL